MPLPARVSDLTGFDLLLSVARTGSIGRAAAEHGVSQPAASARMRLLEGQPRPAPIPAPPPRAQSRAAPAAARERAPPARLEAAPAGRAGGGLGPGRRGRRGVAGRR